MDKVYVPDRDAKLKMHQNMLRYGGSFVTALAEAFMRTDSKNLRKLCKAFPKLVETYVNW